MRRSSATATLLATALLLLAPVPASAADNVIFTDGFETGDLSLWDNVNTDRYDITSAPGRVKTGSYALEGTIPEGDGWGEINKWFLPGYNEIFVRFDVMFEGGFQNLRGDGNGMHFASVSGNRVDNKWSAHGKAGIVPNGSDFFTTTVDPNHRYGDDTLYPLMFYSYFPDMTCCYGNVFEQPEPQIPLVPGQWHELIVHVDAGTPGAHDGSQQLWIDGELAIDVQSIRWRDTTDLRLNEFAIVDYMPGSLKTQHIWYDNVLVTTDFPGSEVGTPTTFIDVTSTSTFFSEIEWLADGGITKGCNPPINDMFCPNDPVTRGQMAAFLNRALHLPASGNDVFSDDNTSVFQADINALAASGITKGCNPPTQRHVLPRSDGDPWADGGVPQPGTRSPRRCPRRVQ